ncbi:hypothetical protein CAAN1_10S03290 [[Candida] anglica]|uniref:Proteasome assembly chaperone 1 n=1 Tax=[Candida] anglica TaxID=148631 RepID=A0ABP0EH17_9ASCO
MLIKPWNDLPTPRHALEEDSNEQPQVPIVDITLDETVSEIDHFLVIPSSIKVVEDGLVGRKIGSIRIYYKVEPKVDAKIGDDDEEEDYDEDEQLYKVIVEGKSNTYEETIIPIVHSLNSISIVVPNFKNVIANNFLARKLIEQFDSIITKSWITLAPCHLNNGQTLSKLEASQVKITGKGSKIPESYTFVPKLNPPHFITGISASVNSVLNLQKEPKLVSLVLNADGQPGYEKLDSDAIMDAAYVVGDFITIDAAGKEKYIQAISKQVRKFNSYSNSGMYL